MESIINLAKYIISKRYSLGKPINNLDLQHILKQIQDKTHCFYDECDMSKGYPVYLNVYYRFCGFGIMPIWLKYDVSIDSDNKIKIDNIIKNFTDTTTCILENRARHTS